MVAKFTRGITFAPGSTVGATQLHALWPDSSTLAGVSLANVNTAQGRPVSVVNSFEEMSDGDVGVDENSYWIVTKLSTANGQMKSMIAHGHQCRLGEAPTVEGGELLIATDYEASPSGSTDPDIVVRKMKSTDDPWKVLGVSATRIVDGARGVVVIHGIVRVKTDGSTLSVGQDAKPSTTTDGAVMAAAAEGGAPGSAKVGKVIAKYGSYAGLLLSKL